MTLYTAHAPRPGSADLEALALAPERFSFAAFLFGPLWLIAHRLWAALVLWLAGAALFAAACVGLGPRVTGLALAAAGLALETFFALEANHLRRSALVRSGRPIVDVVCARDRDEAAARHFARRAVQSPQVTPREVAPAAAERGSVAPREGAFLSMFPDERAP